MNSNAEQAAEQRKDPAWLATLPRKTAAAVESALRALPANLPAAGEDLPVVIAAWSLADPGVAAGLIEKWLGTVDGEGNLTPTCPVACQLAEWVAGRLPDPEPFLARIRPGLGRCVERELDRYDAQGMGLPLWSSATEALFPAEFAPGRFTVDLAILLSNEAAAFCRLAEGHAELDRALGDAEGVQRELDNWVMEDFWDPEAAVFLRHDEGAESALDFSPCGFLPLIWEESTNAMSESLRTRSAELDPAVWPARAWELFFALLLRTPHASVIGKMRRQGLPAGASPVEMAAWTVLAAGADAARKSFLAEVPGAARWADAHGRGIARGLLSTGVALVVAALGWGFIHREDRAGHSAADLERRARLACGDGAHARAAALYGQAARRGGAGPYFRYRQAGEWMHLGEFAAAEAAYREVQARAPDTFNARMNLALSVLRQGRREEALGIYRAVAEEPGVAPPPELVARARLAAELIERQIALDRAEPEERGTAPGR